MKTIIIASLFCMDNFLPILLGLLGAALLGWLLKGFMSGSNETYSKTNEWETKYNGLAADLAKEKERSAKLSASANKKSSNSNVALGAAAVAVGGASAAELESLQNKMRNLKDELKASNEAKIKIEAEVNAANTRAKEATTLNSELETAKMRIEGLAKALDTAKAEADKYKGDFENANSERTRLGTQLSTSEVGSLQKRIDKLENDLDTARMTTSNLQVELDRAKNGAKTISQVVPVRAEKAAPNTKELEAELATLRGNQERVEKATELNKLAINAAVNEANSKNSAEIIDLRSKLKAAEATIGRLEDDKTKLAMAVGATSVKVKEVEPIVMGATVVEEKPEPIVEVVAEPEPIIEVVAQNAEVEMVAEVVADAKKDDLTVIEGIGPKIAELMHNDGLHTYAQMADAPLDRLQGVLDAAGSRYSIANPGTWAEQATLLRDGKMNEFKTLCEELDGGVRVDEATKAAKAAAKAEVLEASNDSNTAIENAAAEALEKAKSNPDDLKVLEGIGPKLAAILNEGGIYTYAQLAGMEASAVKAILEASGDMMHDPATWPEQASLLRDGKMEEFAALCDRLKGGRE